MEGLTIVGKYYALLPDDARSRMRRALRDSLCSFDHASDIAADCILENIWNEAVGNN